MSRANVSSALSLVIIKTNVYICQQNAALARMGTILHLER